MKKKALLIGLPLLFVGVVAAVVGAWGYLSSAPPVSSVKTASDDVPEEVVIPKPKQETASSSKDSKQTALSESVKRVESKLTSAKQRNTSKPLVPARPANTKASSQVPIRPAPTPALKTQDEMAQPQNMEEPLPEEDTTQEPMASPGSFTADKLNALALGMTYEQVAMTVGDAGRILGDGLAVPYQPIGWATVEWGSREKGLFTAMFNADEQLVAVDVFNVPGAEALAAAPANAIRAWLNNAMAQERLAVRVPVVIVKPSGPGNYEYSAALISEPGVEVGEIAGFYHLGDGATTVAAGDDQPYSRLLEGVYDVTWEDGSNASDAFSLVDY